MDRGSETQLQVGGNFKSIISRLKGNMIVGGPDETLQVSQVRYSSIA